MRAKVLKDDGERVFAVIFETGDDPVAGLTRLAEEKKLAASSFTAIGAFSEATLGYFDWEKKDYERIPVKEQVEVAALIGDVVLDEGGKPTLGKPFAGEVRENVPATYSAVPMQFVLHLNRAGKFTVQLKARDLISKKTAELSFPLVVMEVK
jgi:hypothetical protein